MQGVAVLLITLAIYGFTLNQGRGEIEARSLAFTTLVIANLGLILSNRFWSKNVLASLRYKNTALFIIIAATLAILTLVIYAPFLRELFHFGILHPNDLALCFGAGIVCILWFEAVKYFSRPIFFQPKKTVLES
jgi:Ca2+-transporting ATPase